MEDDTKTGGDESVSHRFAELATRRSIIATRAAQRIERFNGATARLDSIVAHAKALEPITAKLSSLTHGSLGSALSAAAILGSSLGPIGSTLAAVSAVARSTSLPPASSHGIGAAIAHSSVLPISEVLGLLGGRGALSANLRMVERFHQTTNLPKVLRPEIRALKKLGLYSSLKDAEIALLEELIGDALDEQSAPENEQSQPQPEPLVIREEAPVYSAPASSAQEQAIAALESQPGEANLSAQALAIILTVLLMTSALYEKIGQWNDFRESVCDFNQRILTAPSLRDAHKQINALFCVIPPEVSAQMRLVNRDGVELLDNPRRNSTKIMPLPRSSIVEVLDSKGRNWVQVLYKHEGLEIVGWVSRSMVRTIPGR